MNDRDPTAGGPVVAAVDEREMGEEGDSPRSGVNPHERRSSPIRRKV
jgi:hypothetical protein